jgi:hypothetical protein
MWNKQRYLNVGELSILLGVVLLLVAWIIGSYVPCVIGAVFLLGGLVLIFWKVVFNKSNTGSTKDKR